MGGAIQGALRPITGQTANKAAVAGQVFDSVAAGGVTAHGLDTSEPTPLNTGLNTIQTIGGAQTVGLSTSITAGMYGAGATLGTAGSGILLPLGLAGLGGVEVGLGIYNLYQNIFGDTFGGDIYDWLNDPVNPNLPYNQCP